MGLKIRLRQQGRSNARTFRLVLADVKSPRDGKYVETLGWYNPQHEGELEAKVDDERITYWLERGAEPTEKALSLIARLAPASNKYLKEKEAAQRAKKAAARRKK